LRGNVVSLVYKQTLESMLFFLCVNFLREVGTQRLALQLGADRAVFITEISRSPRESKKSGVPLIQRATGSQGGLLPTSIRQRDVVLTIFLLETVDH
jgi:hypothetical protein